MIPLPYKLKINTAIQPEHMANNVPSINANCTKPQFPGHLNNTRRITLKCATRRFMRTRNGASVALDAPFCNTFWLRMTCTVAQKC